MSEPGDRPLAPESRESAPGRERLQGRRVLVVGFAREQARGAVADRDLASAEATAE